MSNKHFLYLFTLTIFIFTAFGVYYYSVEDIPRMRQAFGTVFGFCMGIHLATLFPLDKK